MERNFPSIKLKFHSISFWFTDFWEEYFVVLIFLLYFFLLYELIYLIALNFNQYQSKFLIFRNYFKVTIKKAREKKSNMKLTRNMKWFIPLVWNHRNKITRNSSDKRIFFFWQKIVSGKFETIIFRQSLKKIRDSFKIYAQ